MKHFLFTIVLFDFLPFLFFAPPPRGRLVLVSIQGKGSI